MKTSLINTRTIKFGALLLFGFIIGYSFAGSCLKVPTLAEARKEAADKAVQQIKKTMEAKEKSYQQRIDTLNAREEKLTGHLQQIKAQMKTAASRAQRLQDKVWMLSAARKNSVEGVQGRNGIYSIESRNSIYSIQSINSIQSRNSIDSIADNRDLLQAGLVDLAEAQQQKDSLCNEAITNLETQVHNRDSLIAQQQYRYLDIKTTLDKSLSKQEDLALENKQYKKAFKREKRKKAVRTVGTLVVAIGAALLLTR